MKRKALGIAVVLAALAVLINVFALNSASIRNDLSFTIANTEDAYIAITQGTDLEAGFDSSAGYAKFALPTEGFQPNSTYVFTTAFNVVNNSASNKSINIAFDPSTPPPAGVVISFVNASGTAITLPATVQPGSGNALGVGLKFELAPGANTSIGDHSGIKLVVTAS